MEHEYLGEERVSTLGLWCDGFGPREWALWWISQYGWTDGAHHKQWVLDQVARILNGSTVVVYRARWSNGESEYRPRLDDGLSHADYYAWVNKECEDNWDPGIAP